MRVRSLTDSERARIRRERPWFGAERAAAERDLAAGEAEVLDLDVLRAWDLNGCGPPCCPRELLVESEEGTFVHLQSWSVLPEGPRIGRKCSAHRTRASWTLLLFESGGDAIEVESLSDAEREMFFDVEGAECEVVAAEQLPLQFLATSRPPPRP